MTRRRKRSVYVAVGLAISVVLLWLLFREIRWPELWVALKQADYYWLVPMVGLTVLTMYQRAYRWRYMIAPIKNVPFPKLLAATCIGFMANNVLPLRLGEFARAYSLSVQDRKVTKSASLATIFVERMVFDLIALLLIFGVVLWISRDLRNRISEDMVVATYTAIGIALAGIVVMLVLALKPGQVGELLTKYLFFAPQRVKDLICNVIDKFARGLEFLSDSRAVFSIAVQTILIWVLMGVSNYFVFKAFAFDVPLDACFVLLVIVSISILVPSSPGFVGVYHFGVVWSLRVYNIPDENALSCALVLHAAQYIVITLMGFYFLKKEHLSLKRLELEADEPNEG